jgi:hypothetical protein
METWKEIVNDESWAAMDTLTICDFFFVLNKVVTGKKKK